MPVDNNQGLSYQPVPKEVAGLEGVVQVSAGEHHTICATKDGHVYVWGKLENGALGLGRSCDEDGALHNRATPHMVPLLPAPGCAARVAAGSDASFVLHVPAPTTALPSTHVTDLGKLLKVPQFADVVFVVAGERIRAHRSLLSARSEHFESLFSSGTLETQSVVVRASAGPGGAGVDGGGGASAVEVQIPDCSAEAFRRFLKWVYTDELEVDEATVVDVLLQSDCYCLSELREKCAKAAVPLVCMSNIGRVVFAAERVQGGMGLLQDACRDFVLEHLDELEGTPAYDRLLDDRDFMARMLKQLRMVSQHKRKRRRASS
jgi:hypothetical protein